MLSRIKIICQKVATEKFKDLFFSVTGQRYLCYSKISASGDVSLCLAMSYFTPISEFKVCNSLFELNI